jgi:hypothetical protein
LGIFGIFPFSSQQRDLREVQTKLRLVINPIAQSETALRDWDLWGPFIFCLLLCLILSVTAPNGQTSTLFAGVFSIVTFGGGVATVNVVLIGRSVAFFQSLCAIGYCLFPMSAAALVCLVLPWFIVRVIVVPAAFWWSVTSLARFFGHQIPADRRIIGLYPCALLYATVGWIIFLH